MARLATLGFELGLNKEATMFSTETANTFGTVTESAAHVRSGAQALKIANTSSGINLNLNGIVAGNEHWVYIRVYIYITKMPSAFQPLLSWYSVTAAKIADVRLNSDGTVRMFAGGEQRGTVSSALSLNTWYRIEGAYRAVSAGEDQMEFRIDGTSISAVKGNYSTEVTTDISFGFDAGSGTAGEAFFDDCAVNDDTGAAQNTWPGSGKVVLLRPISDKERVGWTGGAGGTTNLWNAVDNLPPLGVANGEKATDASQIKNGNSNTTDTYLANLASYEQSLAEGGGGLGLGDTVMVAQAVARLGNSTTTARKVGISATANPEIGEVEKETFPATAAATEGTGWISRCTAPVYKPAVALSSTPVVKVRKATATTNVTMVDFMCLLVEYLPSTSKVVAIGQVTETETAQAIKSTKLKAIGQVTETETAQAATARRARAIGQVTESETAQAMSALKRKVLGQVTESETAQAIKALKRKAMGQVPETDLAQAFAEVKSRVLGQSTETDLAQPIASAKRKAIGQPTETDTASAMTAVRRVVLERALGTDLAQAFSSRKRKALSLVSETDVARAIVSVKRGIIELVVELGRALKIRGPFKPGPRPPTGGDMLSGAETGGEVLDPQDTSGIPTVPATGGEVVVNMRAGDIVPTPPTGGDVQGDERSTGGEVLDPRDTGGIPGTPKTGGTVADPQTEGVLE